MSAEVDYGLCPCGGRFENRWVEIRIKVSDQVITLPSMPQGACPNCGGRVYKSYILTRIESVMNGKPVTEPPSEYGSTCGTTQ